MNFEMISTRSVHPVVFILRTNTKTSSGLHLYSIKSESSVCHWQMWSNIKYRSHLDKRSIMCPIILANLHSLSTTLTSTKKKDRAFAFAPNLWQGEFINRLFIHVYKNMPVMFWIPTQSVVANKCQLMAWRNNIADQCDGSMVCY